MWTRFGDFDRTFSLMDELRRRMDRVWDEYDTTWGDDREPVATATWPRVNVFDAGANVVLTADVPGLSEKDLQISLNVDTLSIAGERKVPAPEGYSVHRQERPHAKFSRSITLPWKVDSERATAALKDGVLTLTLPKAAEAQPRQIAVRAS
jgi:HSP20 family protein